MALTHPVWRHWYEMIFPPLCIIIVVLASSLRRAEVIVLAAQRDQPKGLWGAAFLALGRRLLLDNLIT